MLKEEFCHWPQILSLVFLEVTGSLCSFLRESLTNTHVYLPVVLLSKNDAS